MKRAALVVVAGVLLVALSAPASAGGAWLQSERDRYEVGEVATLVGYTGGPVLPVVPSARFSAFLVGRGEERVPVAPVQLEETGRGGWESIRVTVSFFIPLDMAPGRYEFGICGDPCSSWTGVGDIVGGVVFVGVDPPPSSNRNRPLGAPEAVDVPGAAIHAAPRDRLVPPPEPAAPRPIPVRVPAFQQRDTGLLWPVILGGGVLGLIGVALARRRRAVEAGITRQLSGYEGVRDDSTIRARAPERGGGTTVRRG